MFVIQFKNEQGYIVVSATKNYHPILVEVDSGIYDYDIISQSGISYLYESYKEEIRKSRNLPKESVLKERMGWAKYEIAQRDDYPFSKSSDPLIDLIESSIAEWEAEGYNYYFLGQCPNYLPENIYNRFISIAQNTANENYDYMENSVILELRRDSETNIGPLLTTSWNQHTFEVENELVYTGCATVAIGQILAYHQFPTDINWQLILSKNPFYRRSFLEELAYDLSADFGEDGTGVSIDNVKSYLTQINYSYSEINHNTSTVLTSLNSNYPVYMRGSDSEYPWANGHAWVCDGYRSNSSSFRYILKVISPAEPLSYETVDSYNTSTGNSRFHMNLGWGGSQNGYYHDSNYTSDLDYKHNRKDLVNIHH